MELDTTEAEDWMDEHGGKLAFEKQALPSVWSGDSISDWPADSFRLYEDETLYTRDGAEPIAHVTRDGSVSDEGYTYERTYYTFYEAPDGALLNYRRSAKRTTAQGWVLLATIGAFVGGVAGMAGGFAVLWPLAFFGLLSTPTGLPLTIITGLAAVFPVGIGLFEEFVQPTLHEQNLRTADAEMIRTLLQNGDVRSLNPQAIERAFPDWSVRYAEGEARTILEKSGKFLLVTDDGTVEQFLDEDGLKKHLLEGEYDDLYRSAFGSLPTPSA